MNYIWSIEPPPPDKNHMHAPNGSESKMFFLLQRIENVSARISLRTVALKRKNVLFVYWSQRLWTCELVELGFSMKYFCRFDIIEIILFSPLGNERGESTGALFWHNVNSLFRGLKFLTFFVKKSWKFCFTLKIHNCGNLLLPDGLLA